MFFWFRVDVIRIVEEEREIFIVVNRVNFFDEELIKIKGLLKVFSVRREGILRRNFIKRDFRELKDILFVDSSFLKDVELLVF